MHLYNKIKEYKLILASKSPRRQFLLKEMGLSFDVVVPQDVDEVYPFTLKPIEVPVFLAELKANAFGSIDASTIVITADTIVHLDGKILGKPADYNEAFEMIRSLSGREHQVYTGVCIRVGEALHSFVDESRVFFAKLTDDEIKYYIENYNPYDKAGAYGAQEWIGYVGIERIEGSYFNVMGLPVQRLYEEISKMLS